MKMHLTEIGSEFVNYHRVQWRAFANTSLAALIPRQVDNMLTVSLSDYCFLKRDSAACSHFL
jgi:hypothetical protein